jgi:membrane protein implicated in regulation of membrane protease activity
MMLWQAWWIWIAAGVVLAMLEVLVSGFVLLGFALGAVLTGALILLGLLGQSLAWIVLAFALASLACWALLRAVFGVRRSEIKIWHKDINDHR